jgi:two-component system invasion response regulator UvrY
VITILLADDHTLVREGLRRLLEDHADIQVVGEAPDGHAAVRMAHEHKPDILVMDLSLTGLDGLDAIKRIVSESLSTKILVLTMHATEDYAVRVLNAGARGFLGKGAHSEDLLIAIRKVAAGDVYLPPALQDELPKRYVRGNAVASPLAGLSDRGIQVLKRLAEGRTNAEIAKGLHLGVKTIKTYRLQLLRKLELKTNADLIRLSSAQKSNESGEVRI